MSGYTVVNLKTGIEDLAPKFGYAPNMEARFGNEPLELEKTGLSYQRLAPNFRMPFGHEHEEQEELYVVLSGSMRAKLGDDIVELKALDAVRVAPTTTRQFEGGPEGVELLAFGAPRTVGELPSADGKPKPGWWSD